MYLPAGDEPVELKANHVAAVLDGYSVGGDCPLAAGDVLIARE